MNPSALFAVMSPTAVVIAAFTVFSYYRSGIKEVNDYERDLKELRIQVIKGNVSHKMFRYMKDNLRVEHLFVDESKRLYDMFQQDLVDEITYARMKNVLQLTFNQKLVKIHDGYSVTAIPRPA